jgi:hypothetical protein
MNSVRSNRLTVVIIGATDKPATFIVAGKQEPVVTQRPGDHYLAYGEIASFTRVGQTLRVISGCAWITVDGEDKTLLSGQQMILEPGEDAAVVSALGDEPLVYRIYGDDAVTL